MRLSRTCLRIKDFFLSELEHNIPKINIFCHAQINKRRVRRPNRNIPKPILHCPKPQWSIRAQLYLIHCDMSLVQVHWQRQELLHKSRRLREDFFLFEARHNRQPNSLLNYCRKHLFINRLRLFFEIFIDNVVKFYFVVECGQHGGNFFLCVEREVRHGIIHDNLLIAAWHFCSLRRYSDQIEKFIFRQDVV